jgi:aspartate--ammonia ligase
MYTVKFTRVSVFYGLSYYWKTHLGRAIKQVKDHFERNLAGVLNLIRVSAPILLKSGSGINDNLNGVERNVSFDALDVKHAQIEVVQSLAKWKRMALARYGFTVGEGLYTDMNAIRRDEILDNLHSIYVDQWDWESWFNRAFSSTRIPMDEISNALSNIGYQKTISPFRFQSS